MEIPRRPDRFIEAIRERFHPVGLAVEEDVLCLRRREAIHVVICRRCIKKCGGMSMIALLRLDEEEFANGRLSNCRDPAVCFQGRYELLFSVSAQYR